MRKIIITITLLLGVNSFAQKTDLEYFNSAKERLERAGVSHVVKSDISKAIELNPANTEYRWIRVRCNMTTSSSSDNLEEAIADINFILSKENPSAKLFSNLGLAHQELGKNIYQFKKAKLNTGFSDDNSEYVKQQSIYFQEAINNFESAIVAYKKAIEVDETRKDKFDFEIKSCNEKIEQITNELKNLK